MNETLVSNWLNSKFSNMDNTVLNYLAELIDKTEGRYNSFFEFVSLITENGFIFIILSLIMILIKRYRKSGVFLFGALSSSSVITLLLKDLIQRPRPIVFFETGYAFPSGHTTVVMAAATVFFIIGDKKYSWTNFLYVILVGLSRCYLMVHYPSDILGGLIVGLFGAFISYLIVFKIKPVGRLFKW